MKPITSIVGVLLIILGILALSYQDINYTKREKIVQLGDVEVTANQEKKLSFPPIVGGLFVVAGVVLLIATLGRKNGTK